MSSPELPPLLTTKTRVAQAVGLPLHKLNFWLYGLPSHKRYRVFELRRRSGAGSRTIHAPIKPIKDIQRSLAALLRDCYRPSIYVHGYVSHRSSVSNAGVHRRQGWVLRVDLKDFFPSINYGRVRGLFMAPPFDYLPEVATLLAQICCHENQLPHGAPTSPLISNMICRGLDRALAKQASADHCYYTRYCDDLVFSTSRRAFPKTLATTLPQTGGVVAGDQLREILHKHGFSINDSKTSLRARSQRQIVTGLVVNRFPNIPRSYVRSLRNVLFIWKCHGESSAMEAFRRENHKNRPPDKALPSFSAIIRGRVQYVGSVKGWQSTVYKGLAAKLKEVDETFEPTKRVSDWPPMSFRVFCEGKTDSLHLRAALRSFAKEGRFEDLDLDLKGRHGKGDQDLLKRCESLASVPQSIPCVFVFDRDNPSVVNKVMDGDEPRDWSNNVFSVALPVPPHRDQNRPLCVELLYADSVLECTDGNGRRVYLLTEFDPKNGFHNSEQVVCLYPSSKSLVPEQVIDVASKKNVALSKFAFADAVFGSKPPFDSVDFAGFAGVFEAIQSIRRRILDAS